MRWLGIAATVLACVFVWRELSDVRLFSFAVWRQPAAWIGLALLGVVYAGAGLLLALAWVTLLNSASWGRLARRDGVAIFARTQLLKYLPSNVLHMAGRFASLRGKGVPAAAIIRSTGLEHVFLIAVALGLAALFVLPNAHFWSEINSRTAVGRSLWIAGAALVLLLLGAAGVSYRRKQDWLPQLRAWIFDELTWPAAARAALLHLAFFLTTGAIAAALASLGESSLSLAATATTTGTLAFAWLAGLLTPGAPGGIGVREAVLIVGLQPVLGLETVTFVAVGYRFVTVLGDLLLAAAGVAMNRPVASGAS